MFSPREIRTLVVFLPLCCLVVLGMLYYRPKANEEEAKKLEQEMEQTKDSVEMHSFDPNVVEYEELRALGLTKYEAVSLVKFRTSGKVFRIKEDVALTYGISDSTYQRLKPWIRIGEKYALKPRKTEASKHLQPKIAPTKFRIDTVTEKYLRAIGAFSKRQAEALIRWRDLSGIYDMEELRACYVVSDSVANALEKYVIFPVRKPHPIVEAVEINTADSEELVRVVGIGPKTAQRILDYRKRLGGFAKKEQLAEVKGITESNYEKILKQISCNSCEIQKIDINFASPKILARHPYITPKRLRKLLKTRQLKGGWRTTEELVKEHIFTAEEHKKLAPYLFFSPIPQSNDPKN